MLIGQRHFITVQFHIKIGVVLYIKSILIYEEEGIETSISYVC